MAEKSLAQAESEQQQPKPLRALALDALRGLAILMMCLSGRVPWSAPFLPRWMYHAQGYPPGPKDVPGYTWVDLVFPMFLFSMGVAFPFALSSRLAKGVAKWRLSLGALGRMGSLVFFAIYFQHVVPYSIDAELTSRTFFNLIGMESDRVLSVWFWGLLAFALMFPVYMRIPWKLPLGAVVSIRGTGIILATTLMLMIQLTNGRTFNLWFSNIILIVLANMAFFGSVIWLLTPNRPMWRLLFMVIGLHAHLVGQKYYAGLNVPEPLLIFFGKSPAEVGWFFNFIYLKYLLVVVPATVIGDELMRWMRGGAQGGRPRVGVLAATAAIALAVVVFVHVGLQARWWMTTTAVSLAGCAAVLGLMRREVSPTGRFLFRLLMWGSLWLLLGMAVEPFEGGIKKDTSTMSYYFVSLGLSILVLYILTVLIDLFRWRGFGLLILTGQNPMLAYLGINNLMEALLAYIPGLPALAAGWMKSPPTAAAWAMVKTLVLGALTAAFTKLRITWRT